MSLSSDEQTQPRDLRALGRAVQKLEDGNAEMQNILKSEHRRMNSVEGQLSNLCTVAPELGIIGQFYGNPDENIAEYLKVYELVGKAFGWNDTTLFNRLPALLRGTALEIYDSFNGLPDEEQPKDYASLKQLLTAKLTPAEHQRFNKLLLQGRRKKPAETLAAYGYDIKRLSKAAFAGLDDTARDYLMKEAFIQGLPTPLKRSLMRKEPDTFDAALTLAHKEEAQLKYLIASELGDSPTSDPSLKPVDKTDKICSMLETLLIKRDQDSRESVNLADSYRNRRTRPEDDMRNELRRLRNRLDQYMSRERYVPSTSSYRPGYYNYDSRRSQNYYVRTSGRDRDRDKNPPRLDYRCYRCDRVGHIAADCRTRLDPPPRKLPAPKGQYEGRRPRSLEHRPARRRLDPGSRRRINLVTEGLGNRGKETVAGADGDSGDEDYYDDNSDYDYEYNETVGYVFLTTHQESVPDEKEIPYSDFSFDLWQFSPTDDSDLGEYCLDILFASDFEQVHDDLDPTFNTRTGQSSPLSDRSVANPTFLNVLATLLFGMFLLLLVPFLPGATASSPYLLCGHSRSGYAVEVPATFICSLPLLEAIQTTQVDLFLPQTRPSKATAWHCYTRRRRICTNMGFLGSRGIVLDQTVIEPVGLDACRIAASYKVWRDQRLREVIPGVWTTNNTQEINYQWCCKDFCSDHMNFILELGEVATIDGETVISDLGPTGGCRAQEGICHSETGTVIWNATLLQAPCPYMKAGTYTADYSNTYFIINQIEPFTLTSQPPPSCLPRDAFMTEQGVAIRPLPGNLNLNRPHVNVTARANTVDPTNAKLNYLYLKLTEWETANFRHLWTSLCQLAQRQLQLIHQFLRLDPTYGARVLLNKTDITAAFAGDVLMIWPCRQVRPDKVFWDYKFGTTCYEYVPAQLNGTLFFVLPGTRELTRHAMPVPCHHHFSGIFRGPKGWQTVNGATHVSPVPMEIAWKGHWTPFTFKTPALFHNEMSDLIVSVGHIRSYITRHFVLEQRLRNLVNYTASFSTNPQVITEAIMGVTHGAEDLIDGSGRAIEHVLVGLGHGAGDVLRSAGHTFHDLLDGLLKGPAQAFVNVAVCLSVVVLLACLGYYILRHKLLWALCRTSFNRPVRPRDRDPEGDANVLRDPPLAIRMLPKTLPTPDTNCPKVTSSGFPSWLEDDSVSTLLQQKGKLLTIDLIVSSDHSKPLHIVGLIDTGASISLIHRDQADMLGKLLAPKATASSASGHSLMITGAQLLTFSIGHRKITHFTHVADQLPYDCILGIDLLTKLGDVMISLPDKTILLDGERIPLVSAVTETDLQRPLPVYLIKDILVPPTYEYILWNVQTVPLPAKVDLLFQPDTALLGKYGLAAAHSVCTPTGDCLPVRLLNPQRVPIQLPRHLKIGHLEVPAQIFLILDLNEEKKATKVPKRRAHDLKDLDLSKSNLDDEQRRRLRKLLLSYSDVFSETDSDIGLSKVVQHRIDTGDSTPFKQRPYRTAVTQRDKVQRHIKEMLDNDIISPSTSPWASPIILVKKKDGTDRFVIDYRKLNQVTKKDVYPLPRIDDILDCLENAKYFTSLDMTSGYWQIAIDPRDREKTAFITLSGLYHFNVLTFGLCNAPACFQRLMEYVLAGLQWKTLVLYLDDILIFSSSFEDHLTHITEVLDRFRDHNLKLKTRKCHFARNSISFLGYIVTSQGLRPDPNKTQKVRDFPRPTTIKALRRFLGLSGFYRRFIRNFSIISAPLYNLLKTDVDLVWNDECQCAFETLKLRLTTPPVLAYPDFTKPFILETDASCSGLGAVLSQDRNGKVHPIAYCSRTLSKHEKNYPSTELEALAVVYSINYFKCYLYGNKFTVITDCSPLKSLLTTKNTSGRLVRWSLMLQEFANTMQIKYRPGRKNANADALSRMMVASIAETGQIRPLRRHQLTDPELRDILHQLHQNNDHPDPMNRTTGYYLEDGCLFYKPSTPDRYGPRLVIPRVLKEAILRECHDSPLSGHLGFGKTYQRIKCRYYWPNMRQDIRNWCMACRLCATRKNPPTRPKAPLCPIKIDAPFKRVAVDILGPLPETVKGNKYMIVFMDAFTKWPEIFPIPDMKAETIAKLFVEQIVCRYSAPETLLSDRGTNFMSQLFLEIVKLMNTKKLNTTAYNPKTNGMVERHNRTLLDMLSMYVDTKQDDWDEFLPYIQFAYRTSTHDSTKETPYFLLFGRDPVLPSESAYSRPTATSVMKDTFKQDLIRRLTAAWDLARRHILSAQDRQKTNYDKGAKVPTYRVGDRVYVHYPYIKGQSAPDITLDARRKLKKKLARLWYGPYRITQVNFPNIRVVPIDNPKKDPEWIHVNRAKPCYDLHVPNFSTVPHERATTATSPPNEALRSSSTPTRDSLLPTQTVPVRPQRVVPQRSHPRYSLRPRPRQKVVCIILDRLNINDCFPFSAGSLMADTRPPSADNDSCGPVSNSSSPTPVDSDARFKQRPPHDYTSGDQAAGVLASRTNTVEWDQRPTTILISDSSYILCPYNSDYPFPIGDITFYSIKQAMAYIELFQNGFPGSPILHQSFAREPYGITDYMFDRRLDLEPPTWSWIDARESILLSLMMARTHAHPLIKEELLRHPMATFAFCESRDLFWGTGLHPVDTGRKPPHEWPGTNRLGQLTATLRDLYQRYETPSPPVYLSDWLYKPQLYSRPARPFLILGDHTLAHLSEVESSTIIAHPEIRIKDIPNLISEIDLDDYAHVIVQIGMNDFLDNRQDHAVLTAALAALTSSGYTRTFWCLPIPQSIDPRPMEQFLFWLQDTCLHHKVSVIGRSVEEYPFLTPRGSIVGKFYKPSPRVQSCLDLNITGTLALYEKVWAGSLPAFHKCKRFACQRPHTRRPPRPFPFVHWENSQSTETPDRETQPTTTSKPKIYIPAPPQTKPPGQRQPLLPISMPTSETPRSLPQQTFRPTTPAYQPNPASTPQPIVQTPFPAASPSDQLVQALGSSGHHSQIEPNRFGPLGMAGAQINSIVTMQGVAWMVSAVPIGTVPPNATPPDVRSLFTQRQ